MKKSQQVAIDIDNSVEENREETRREKDGEQCRLLKENEASTSKMKEIQHATENDEDTTTGKKRKERVDISMKKRLDKLPGKPRENRPVTIFRVPAWFHEDNKHLWEPRMVSIGPYHHGNERLRGLEEHKFFALRDFLDRKEVRLEDCLREMRSVEAKVRLCYSETVNMDSDEFVMMLVLDGCFILERLLKWQHGELDSICDVGWTDIYADMYLLENQIPFVVIKKLFFIRDGKSHKCQGDCALIQLIHHERKLGTATLERTQISCSRIQHLLHYHYTALVGSFEMPEHEDVDRHHTMLCASELHETGVKFKKKPNSNHLFNVSFENGILEIPNIILDHKLSVVFWNMVAFEQSQRFTFKQKLSSYFAFMDALVNTQKDVILLQRCGIVESYLESDEEAATFFNQFEKHFYVSSHYDFFNPLRKRIKAYSESTWHKNRARLMHDYFSNPWTVISVFAATILLILTVMQTIYSAK